MNYITGKHLSRRTLLRGVGTALSLPFLDSMVPALKAAKNTAAAPAVRLAFVYVPNGIIPGAWTPKVEGKDFEFTRTMKAIEPFRERLLVLSGLAQINGRALGDGAGDHARAGATWLTGVHPAKTEGAGIHAGISADQVAAKELGKSTQFASLEIGLESPTLAGGCDSGYSCAYSNTISWRGPTTPQPVEINPRAVFERLFGEGDSTDPKARLATLKEQGSLLDYITGDIDRLETNLGPRDRGKLTEYLDSIRDVERRIQMAEEQNDTMKVPLIERPAGVPAEYDDHAKLMMDLQVIAFQADLTRVITFMMGREGSDRSYRNIGISDGHHPLTHHQNDPEKIEKVTQIDTYHVKLLSYYLDKLQSTKDGDGTLLDHSLVLYGSSICDGNAHTHHDLPLVMVGGAAGQVKGGRHIRFPKETPMNNLLLTILDKAKVPVPEKLGDSTGEINLLSEVQPVSRNAQNGGLKPTPPLESARLGGVGVRGTCKNLRNRLLARAALKARTPHSRVGEQGTGPARYFCKHRFSQPYLAVVAALIFAGIAHAATDLRLVDAIKRRDHKGFSALLAAKADVNAAQPDGATALSWAAYLDDRDSALALLAAGAKVNTSDEYGETPLTLACSIGDDVLVGKLLKAGANVKAARWNGETALMIAANSGSVAAVKELIAAGADVNATEPAKGQNALMWAAAEKHADVVQALIDAGADVKAASKSGFTPLVFAAEKNAKTSVEELIAAGADPNYALPDGTKVLSIAAASKSAQAAIMLLDHGADPNIADRTGVTPLHTAAQTGSVELANKLLAKGANPDARTNKTQPGRGAGGGGFRLPPGEQTALMMAARANQQAIMKALIDHHADPKLKAQDGTTLLMAAAGSGHVGVVKYAYEFDQDVKAATDTGDTIAHSAVTGTLGPLATQADICEVIQFLFDKGAPIDEKNARGRTPMDIADILPIDKAVELMTSLIIKSGAKPVHPSNR